MAHEHNDSDSPPLTDWLTDWESVCARIFAPPPTPAVIPDWLSDWERVCENIFPFPHEVQLASAPLPVHFRQELVALQWECQVCREEMTAATFNLTHCFHKICTNCAQALREPRCPVCRSL